MDELKSTDITDVLMSSAYFHSVFESIHPFADNLVVRDEGSTSNAMLIDWKLDREKNSPHVWRFHEFDYLMSRPECECYARKFIESVDMDIVRLIERKLL